MFSNRWHLAWLGICFLAATAGAFVLLFWLIVDGLPGPYYGPIGLAGFLLTVYTLPLVSVYLAGLGAGWAVRQLYRVFIAPRRARRWTPRPVAVRSGM